MIFVIPKYNYITQNNSIRSRYWYYSLIYNNMKYYVYTVNIMLYEIVQVCTSLFTGDISGARLQFEATLFLSVDSL